MNRALSLFAALAFSLSAVAGPIVVRVANYINYPGQPSSQTFTLGTQVFTGSTDCTSGGGAVATTNGVDYLTGATVNVANGDSILLTVDPGTPSAQSDQNGLFVSWGSDASLAPFMSLPGDGRTVCVAGFDGAVNRDYYAYFYAGIQTLDACGNERTTWAPGETVTFKVSGGVTFEPEAQRFLVAGGSVNECTWVPEGPTFATVYVDSDPWTYSFTLPTSDAEIPAACLSSNSTSILGSWRAVAYDPSCGCNRAQTVFTVANDAPAAPPCALTCPADIVVDNDPNECGAIVNYATPSGATCDHASGSMFPIGTTAVACSAGALSCNFNVTVNDAEEATATASVAPFTLWPPNHKMVPVTVTASATDNCAAPVCAISSVTSNEADEGLGDGDRANDIQIVDASHVMLRAERSGAGTGRVYTITVTCGSASEQVTVSVRK